MGPDFSFLLKRLLRHVSSIFFQNKSYSFLEKLKIPQIVPQPIVIHINSYMLDENENEIMHIVKKHPSNNSL